MLNMQYIPSVRTHIAFIVVHVRRSSNTILLNKIESRAIRLINFLLILRVNSVYIQFHLLP